MAGKRQAELDRVRNTQAKQLLDVLTRPPAKAKDQRKVWSVTHIYDIGSCHPEVSVSLYMTEKEAHDAAREEAKRGTSWENDPDLDDEADEDDLSEGYVRVDEHLLP